MKCSLLTLSTFIDGELAPQRRAEVDAHLVGCTRCSAGAATLREEKSRVGQLARVTVDPGSAQLMLEQVGIAVDSAAGLSPAPPAPSLPPPDDDRRPWQRAASSAALPWTPHRPDPRPPVAAEELVGAANGSDDQPELPLEGVRAVPASWNRSATVDSPPLADPEEPHDPGATSAARSDEWAVADDERTHAGAVPESWEADLPPPAEPAPPHLTSWSDSPPLPPVEATAPPPPATTPAPPVVAGAPPPTRAATASGPAALWARMHDAVSVRLALARGGGALEDSAHIVSGAPARRAATIPPPELAAPDLLAESPSTQTPPAMVQPDAELTGADEIHVPAVSAAHPQPLPPVAGRAASGSHRAVPEVEQTLGHDQATGNPEWNAFAASSYPGLDAPEHVAEPSRPRPLGRHSRAVARDQVPLSRRIGRASATAAAAVRAGAGTASARLRQGLGRAGKTGLDYRLLAGIAAIGVIFVVALVVGRSKAPPTPVATRPPSTTSQAQSPHASAPAQSSAAAASVAPAPTAVQTYGAGGTGFQVIRLRYGVQTHYLRVVFDVGAANGTAAGTPKVTIAFTTATTMLVTFTGTAPAGSTGTPPPGNVISSVTLVSSGGNKAVYRFSLSRAATATAFYLAAPTRFVLDIH